ncbi:molybdenum ABC transporter ATP-binding protein [Marinomonas sp.]|nr:molybdenum ABC transporter ATP-binding protein [Marinomonas sp.]MDB4837785.1 molybdenum ABC transporter ATP-binding protein [Marinomonas sp.]
MSHSEHVIDNKKKSLRVRIQQQYSAASEFALSTDLNLPNKGVTAIFGPSGSGKTTLLRSIAGLESNLKGDISLNDEYWLSSSLNLPTHKRPIGYVFQEGNLFPHLTADENLQFALKRVTNKSPSSDYEEIVHLLNIQPILTRYPSQLSGGERQRIAIARALLIQPKLLLMDEPLTALDDALKQEILPYLEKVCQHANMPILYVSHSLDEVIRLADFMVVLEKGEVVEQGRTQRLLGKLGTSFTSYQDASVVLTGRVSKQSEEWGLSWLNVNGQDIKIRKGNENIDDTLRIRVQAKDVSLTLREEGKSSILNRLNVTLDELQNDPNDSSMVLVRLLTGDTPILARVTRLSAHTLNLEKGQKLIAQIKSVALLR